MKSKIQIIPAILAFDESEYQKKIDIVNNAPEFDNGVVQVDITDGKFCESKSVGSDIISKYPINRETEFHLMVQKPLDWIDDLAKLKTKRIVISLESDNVGKALNKTRDLGLEVGLGVNPETPIDRVLPYVDKIDMLLLLSVSPGVGGQKFIEASLEKIRKAGILKKNRFKIEVDGGINQENIKQVAEAGVDGIVIGERLIYGDIGKNLETIWEKLNC